MHSNRRWIALAFFVFGVVFLILLDKFFKTVMGWTGIADYNFELPNENFTLTTLLGLVVSGLVTSYCYRHPTISSLSNEVVAELKKVTWPNASETRSATIVVIITVFIMALFLGLFDLFWSVVMDWIYKTM